jgi:predicted amino acid-binding ACT domain protein
LRCSRGFEKEVQLADTVRGVEYYYLTVPDAPSESQRILSALKHNGVNLLAFLGFPLGGGQSQIDLVLENPQSLREAAEQAGVTLSESKRALLIQGHDRVGAVADISAKLAKGNINLTAAAATGAGSGRFGMILWVVAADYETASEALSA